MDMLEITMQINSWIKVFEFDAPGSFDAVEAESSLSPESIIIRNLFFVPVTIFNHDLDRNFTLLPQSEYHEYLRTCVFSHISKCTNTRMLRLFFYKMQCNLQSALIRKNNHT